MIFGLIWGFSIDYHWPRNGWTNYFGSWKPNDRYPRVDGDTEVGFPGLRFDLENADSPFWPYGFRFHFLRSRSLAFVLVLQPLAVSFEASCWLHEVWRCSLWGCRFRCFASMPYAPWTSVWPQVPWSKTPKFSLSDHSSKSHRKHTQRPSNYFCCEPFIFVSKGSNLALKASLRWYLFLQKQNIVSQDSKS